MTMKKYLRPFLAGTAALLLAACGNGGSSNDEIQEGSKQSGEGETVEVTYWHAMNGPHQEATTELVNQFNESQDKYKVVEQNQGDYDTLQQKIMASAAAQDGPTMAQVTASNIPDYSDAGLIQVLDEELLTGEDGFSQEQIDDIFPGFLEGSKMGDDLYAIPFSKSVRVMYLNQDILDEYEMETPTTWEDVQELGEKMQENGDDRFALGLENGFAMELETMARQNGADWVSDDLSTVDIASDEATEPMQFINDGLDAGWARTAGEDGFMSGPFGRGEVAVYLGSSAGLAHVEPVAEENGINWTTAEIPVYDDGDKLTLLAGNDLSVFSSASDEEKAGAVAFMSFLLQEEQTADWAIKTGYLPITQSGLNSDTYQSYLEENPLAVAASKEAEYAKQSPMFVGGGEYFNAMVDALDKIVVNGEDVDQVMADLEEQTISIIEENNDVTVENN
ncbi:ABC transporter substrate-binding protein [Aerococcus kribbianus]|uniref:ABC transporter substrate-binding protein n=1 Tax=Aerococcus kribbianus TaxID=2999064 RepID=A0A9X3JF92_9LACT|nr:MULTISPECIES: ABC transporter substrate-binding protein [unclassified Aerococcus]MCZ0716842.1 ABC transporter substrate-binding protein [Aerococcus sp. YH-aer221]MCZ0725130.1 ABC transporter substrate-binding protein [Aerococcus sp. YH-aer222]